MITTSRDMAASLQRAEGSAGSARACEPLWSLEHVAASALEALERHGGARVREFSGAMKTTRWAVVGGLVRDALLGCPPRDIDLVVQASPIDVVQRWPFLTHCRPNALGGWKFRAGRVSADLWVVESVEKYPQSAVLDIDAVAVEPTGAVHQLGFVDAMSRHTAELMTVETEWPGWLARKCRRKCLRHRFNMGPRLRAFVREYAA